MRNLQHNFNGETRLFRADGTVAVLKNGKEVVKGKWRTKAQGSEPQDNAIRYDIDNAPQPPVRVQYSFNEFNQLVAVIPAAANGGAASASCVWLGQIAIDDANDLTYSLLLDEGPTANNDITVYGKLHFAEDTADLIIDLNGGGQATIHGEKGAGQISTLAAEKNLIAEFNAQDLLRFVARTRNDFTNLPVRIPSKADIKFLGNWDIDEQGGLVFVSKVSTDPSKGVAIGFAGKVKAVTVGFAYFADKAGQQLAFTIAGRHRWNSTAAAFELSLGHTEKRFLASFKGSISAGEAGGRQFVMDGSLKLQLEQGKSPVLDLNLKGEYKFDDKGRISFFAAVSTVNDQLNFNLGLEGSYIFRQGQLNFQVRVNKTGSSTTTVIQLSFTKPDLKLMLSTLLEISPNKVTFNVAFEVRLRFKDGVLLKDKPKELPA